MTMVTMATALRRIDEIIAALSKHAREFGYVAYDDGLSDGQVKDLFSGDESRRQNAIESIDDFHDQCVDSGIELFIDTEVSDEDRELLEQFDLLRDWHEESLFNRLGEVDTSDVMGDLVKHTHRKPFRLATGHAVAGTGQGTDEETAEQVQLLAGHLRSLGMTVEAATAAATELVGEMLYYDSEVLIVWHGEVADLIDKVRDAHFGSLDNPNFTFTWKPESYRELPGGAQIVLWDSGSGAGHSVDAGPDIKVTANILEDLTLDGARGWSWTGDCAGIYLPAIMADATLTQPATEENS